MEEPDTTLYTIIGKICVPPRAPQDISPEDLLESLQISSLAFIELMLQLEDAFGLDIGDDFLARESSMVRKRYPDVRSVIDRIKVAMAAPEAPNARDGQFQRL